MSDTQGYAGSWSRVLDSMYAWVAAVRESENVVALLHTGDFVQDLTQTEQWLNVQRADEQLPKDLLRVSVGGNHDIGSDASEPENYLAYRTDTQITEAASFLDGQCRYVTLEAGGVRIIVISIAYLCEAASAEWAVDVLREHADHYAILMAHSYLTFGENGLYHGYTSGGTILRDQIVKPSPNVRLVLCGHTHGSAMRPLQLDDDGDGAYDREVRQFLSNFQDADLGQAGFLRLMRFDTAEDRIEMTTYSPFIDRYGAPNDPLGAVYTVEDAGLAAYRIG
jgi:predicted phosphodiesterase